MEVRLVAPSAPEILAVEPALAIGFDRGIFVGIYRAPVQGERIDVVRRAFEYASARSPRGVIAMGGFRLTPEFPIDINVGDNYGELAELLRDFDRASAAIALVLEFGGVRAAVMRAATRMVRAVARPRVPLADFSVVSDAVAWLMPHAERVRAPTDFRSYVGLYRRVDRELAELDARRGRSTQP